MKWCLNFLTEVSQVVVQWDKAAIISVYVLPWGFITAAPLSLLPCPGKVKFRIQQTQQITIFSVCVVFHADGTFNWGFGFGFFFFAVVAVTGGSVRVQTDLVLLKPTCLIAMWQKYRQFCCISSSTAISQRQGPFQPQHGFKLLYF